MVSQLGQDDWVLSKISTPGYFVDIGASDGITNSNTFKLEAAGWNGLCVEPNPIFFEHLANNRKCQVSYNAVYTISNQWLELVMAGELSTLSGYVDADSHAKERQNKPSEKVITKSLDDLLKYYDVPKRIDYLSIDTEGSELDILSAFSWSYDIQLITVEHNYSKNRDSIRDLLIEKGYQRVDLPSQWDDWYEKG